MKSGAFTALIRLSTTRLINHRGRRSDAAVKSAETRTLFSFDSGHRSSNSLIAADLSPLRVSLHSGYSLRIRISICYQEPPTAINDAGEQVTVLILEPCSDTALTYAGGIFLPL